MSTRMFGFHSFLNRNDQVHPRVLIVEDEEESEILFEKSLRSIDDKIHVKWVKSVDEAERVLQKNSDFNLVIADYFLNGDQTGIQLWRRCRNLYKHIKFVITSAVTYDLFAEALESEPEKPSFLQKPYLMEDCRNVMVRCLEEYVPELPHVKSLSHARLKAWRWTLALLFVVIVGFMALPTNLSHRWSPFSFFSHSIWNFNSATFERSKRAV